MTAQISALSTPEIILRLMLLGWPLSEIFSCTITSLQKPKTYLQQVSSNYFNFNQISDNHLKPILGIPGHE